MVVAPVLLFPSYAVTVHLFGSVEVICTGVKDNDTLFVLSVPADFVKDIAPLLQVPLLMVTLFCPSAYASVPLYFVSVHMVLPPIWVVEVVLYL